MLETILVTKTDLAVDQEQIEKAQKLLTLAGAGRVFKISNTAKTGIQAVKKFISEK